MSAAETPGRLPDFIIIGAAKAGTTSLFDYLAARPDVFAPARKEPEFFARDELYARGLDSYRALFAGARADQLVGEGSTLYSLAPHFPHAAERIAAAVPEVRLVYLLREPVARAHSFYAQIVKGRQGSSGDLRVARSFEDCIFPAPGRAVADAFYGPHQRHFPDVPGTFLDGSDYVTQIETYLRHFPADQILFATFEEMIADPAAVLGRVERHLGLPPAPRALLPESNRAADFYREHAEASTAAALSRRLPLVSGLRHLLTPAQRRMLRRAVHRVLGGGDGAAAGDAAPPRMRETTRALLAERFGRDRGRVAELTGLDLDRWWGPAERAGLKVTEPAVGAGLA